MVGDDRVRFCGLCQRNVYYLSGMSRPDIERLIEEKEGRLCVRFYQRADGRMLTADCPVGLRAARRWMARITGAVLASIAALFIGILNPTGSVKSKEDVIDRLREIEPLEPVVEWLFPRPKFTRVVAGVMCPRSAGD
jgi:hypothetical protein